jgi:hypothetical protein
MVIMIEETDEHRESRAEIKANILSLLERYGDTPDIGNFIGAVLEYLKAEEVLSETARAAAVGSP